MNKLNNIYTATIPIIDNILDYHSIISLVDNDSSLLLYYILYPY